VDLKPIPRALRVTLAVVAWFNLVSALVGMLGLTVGGGLGIPLDWLEGSIFTSYFWPGIILGVVVGGVQALALVAQYGRFRVAWGGNEPRTEQ
jgi:integral membrane sensor domain MASE1